MKLFEHIFQILHNMEQDNLPVVIQLGQEKQRTTAQNFYKNNKHEAGSASIEHYINYNPNKAKGAPNEQIEFKTILQN